MGNNNRFAFSLLKNKLFKNAILFTASAFLNQGVNFILIFVLSIYLSKNDFGTLNLFNVFTTIASTFITLSTTSYLGVAFFQKKRENFIAILNVIFIVTSLILVLSTLILIVFSQQFTSIIGFETKYQVYGILFCALQVYYIIHLEIYRLNERPIAYACMSFFWILLNVILTVLFCFYFDRGWGGRVEAQLISSIVFYIISTYLLKRAGYIKLLIPSKKIVIETLRFSVPLIPHNSTVWIRQGMDRYILNALHGAVVVADYSFAYNLSGVVMMIGTAFNATNSVFIFKSLQSENVDETRRIILKHTKLMVFFLLSITLLGLFVSFAIIYFFMHKYSDSIPFLFPLFGAAFFQCIYYLFVNYLFFFNKTKDLMYITFSVSIIHFLFSLLTTRYSPFIPAYLSLFSNFIICFLVIVKANKLYPLWNNK